MIALSKNFWDRVSRGEKPVPYIIINTHFGYRAYAERELNQMFDVGGLIADGTTVADGSASAGAGLGLLEKSARVKAFGSWERTIQPKTRDVLGSMEQRQLQHLSVSLLNQDLHFSRIIAREPFLSRTMAQYMGFTDLPFAEHLKVFEGIISEASLDAQRNMTIEADER